MRIVRRRRHVDADAPSRVPEYSPRPDGTFIAYATNVKTSATEVLMNRGQTVVSVEAGDQLAPYKVLELSATVERGKGVEDP